MSILFEGCDVIIPLQLFPYAEQCLRGGLFCVWSLVVKIEVIFLFVLGIWKPFATIKSDDNRIHKCMLSFLALYFPMQSDIMGVGYPPVYWIANLKA